MSDKVNLTHKLDDAVDFTDSNKASDIAHKALYLMRVCARVLDAEHSGLRMGRDNATEMSAAVMDLARKMNLLEWNFMAKDVEELFEALR